MHAKASLSSKTGKVIAVTFLKNAILNDGTLLDAKVNLVKDAKKRKEKETSSHNSCKMIPAKVFTTFIITVKELAELGSEVTCEV